jgi:hypothetical protein
MQRHTACTGLGSPGRSHTGRSLDTSKQSYNSGSLSANRSQGIYLVYGSSVGMLG